MMKEKKLTFAPTLEVEARRVDIDALVAILEPDAEFRPLFLSDEASAFDITSDSEEELRSRLVARVGEGVCVELHQPLWRLVDQINSVCPGWRS